MEKIRRKGKAEGSVLFTVVSVMMVMVVFLMSTLVLTTSANRRSYYTFYENQAQYTAQGVLDAISNSAYSDEFFYNWVKSLTAEGEVDVQMNNTRIPLTKGSSVRAFVEPISDNYIWDQETGAIYCQKGWKITVTASVGQGRNASESTMANYIYENISNPILSANQNTASILSANPLKSNKKQTGPGSSGSGSPNKAKAMFTGSGAGFYSGNNLLCLGPQTFGITSFPMGNGRSAKNATTYDTAVWPEGHPKAGQRRLNAFANQSTTVGDGLFVGNFTTNDKVIFDFQNANEGVQIWGNFEMGGANFIGFYSDLNTMPTAYRDIPYIYCDGNLIFSANNDSQVGNKSPSGNVQPVNIYTNQITNAPTDMMGDIFIFDPTQDSTLTSNKDTKLSRFIGDNIKKTNTAVTGYVGGDVICNSKSLTLNRVPQIGGDLIFTNPEGTLTISNLTGKAQIDGAILCAGKLVIDTGDKGMTVAGGIYADPAKTTITGRDINGLNKEGNAANELTLANICDHTDAAPYPYHKATSTGGTYDNINNTSTSAHFESLGMAGLDDQGDYNTLVKGLLTGHLGATFYEDGYTGPDYSMFPFCSRQDEIFDSYRRWDLAAGTQEEATANMNGDIYVQESIACGHKWGVVPKESDEGKLWIPYTLPTGVQNSEEARTKSGNPFIPPLETAKSADPGIGYESDYDTFKTKYSISGIQGYGDLQAKTVSFVSHDADGGEENVKLDSHTYVVTKNCEINIGGNENNTNYYLFIDPTAENHNSDNPLAVVIGGEFANSDMTIVVNNSGTYAGSGSGRDYSQFTSYAKSAESGGTVTFAGRSDVVIFLRDNIYASQNFRLTTTGCYSQMVSGVYNVVSNPVYPGVKQDDGTYALNADWKNLKDEFKYKFEMIPNVVVYGQKGCNYNTSHVDPWSGQRGPAFLNGATFNAEVIMPESIYGSPAGNQKMYAKSITYREFNESVPYTYPSNDKLIMTLGTLYTKDLEVKNVPLCVYLGDLGRPGSPPTFELEFSGVGADGTNAGNISFKNKNDYFSNDHQNLG